MTPEATLARFREYMVGPTRFAILLSCFELGLIDALRETPGLTAAELGAAVEVKAGAVEQLLQLPVKEGFIAHDEASGGYRLTALAALGEADLNRLLAFMNMIKVVILRQSFHLTESVRDGSVVGLKELYGRPGNMFDALSSTPELLTAWMRLAELETAHVYPWYFGNIDIPAGARVLDVLGGAGLGAIMTCRTKASPGLRVTTFDRPELEAECLRNFEAAGVAEQCSFLGGDVLTGLPEGFDVITIMHFLDMFDQDEAFRILTNAHRALAAGGRIIILVPTYPEDVEDPGDYQVDFFPAFILGAAVGRGGAQKVSTYRNWLEQCGFDVTDVVTVDPATVPADTIVTRAILSATKEAS